MPDVHGEHCPPLHTLLSPHDVPLSAFAIVSVHVATLPAQEETVPLWHEFSGVQAALTVQPLQIPE